MPRLVDGILIEDDSSSIASDLGDSIANLNIPTLDGRNCVEHGSLHSCHAHNKVSVGSKPPEDPTHPRHPDFARRFCKTIVDKHHTRALVREVAREKHAKVVKERIRSPITRSTFWSRVVAWGDDMTNTDILPDDNCYRKSRKWLAVNLEKKSIAIVLVALLLLDLCCLSTEIVLQEIYHDVHGHKKHEIEQIEEALRAVSISILGLFALEILILMYAFNLYFFTKPFYVLDVIVVGGSLFAEIYLRNVLAAGLLVLLRGWRLVRIFHGVYSIGHDAKEDLAHKLHDTAHALLETHWELQEAMRETRVAERKYTKLKELFKEVAQKQATHVGEGEVAVKGNLRVDVIEKEQTDEPALTREERKDLKKQKKKFKKDDKKAKKAAKEKRKEKERQEGTAHDTEFFSPV